MKDHEAGSSPGPEGGPAAEDRLRLRGGADVDEIIAVTLEAIVPGFADASVIYAAESLIQDDLPLVARSVRQDASGRAEVRRAGARFTWGGPDAGAFPPGEAVVFAAGSPYARCISSAKPVVFARPSSQTLEAAGPGIRDLFARYASFLAVPLQADGAVVGIITLAREPVRPPFSESDISGIARIAACAGAGIDTLTALERHRSASAALQQGLLAAEPAQPRNLEVSGRCAPAGGHAVGGDWYDVIALPGGRTGIIVGDVMGHGAEAAAVMAQLRAAAHVLAGLGLPPGAVLSHLNEFLPTLRPAPIATCVCAVIDPAEQSCTLAAAGHLPPVLAITDGTARVLDLPGEVSLGIGPASYGQARVKLRPGATLAFYTDGLVETRTRSFEQGITVLRTELARAEGPLEATLDAIIQSLADSPEDDVTLVLARIPA